MGRNEQLRQARIDRRWSITQAARRIGVGRSTYVRWEQGTQQPHDSSLMLACQVFNRSPEQLGLEHSSTKRSPEDIIQAERHPGSLMVPGTPGVPECVPVLLPECSAPTTVFDAVTRQTVTIVGLVATWQQAERCAHLQQLLHVECTMFDASEHEQNPLSRRQALMVIAALPYGLVAAGRRLGTAVVPQEFLPSCTAAVTSCWQLIGDQGYQVVEESIAQYLPELSALAQSSPYRQSAAFLAAQSQLLLGLVALHQRPAPQNTHTRLLHCRQAVDLARVSEDRSLLIVALTHMGSVYLDNAPSMIAAYEEAAQLSTHETVSPMLRNKVLIERAWAYAHVGQGQLALYSSGEEQTTNTQTAEQVPVSLPDSGPFWGAVMQTRMFQELGYQQSESDYYHRAWTTIESALVTTPTLLVPERLRLEGINHKALVALRLSDLERFCDLSIQGIQGARALQSNKRLQEVVTNWREARKVWPKEQRVMELADLLLA